MIEEKKNKKNIHYHHEIVLKRIIIHLLIPTWTVIDKRSPEPVVDNDSMFLGLSTRVLPFPLLPLRVFKSFLLRGFCYCAA